MFGGLELDYGPVWGAFPSFCVCGKLQKQEAPPHGIASPTNEKLQKLILHCKPRSLSGRASRAFAFWPPPPFSPSCRLLSPSPLAAPRPLAARRPLSHSLACLRRGPSPLPALPRAPPWPRHPELPPLTVGAARSFPHGRVDRSSLPRRSAQPGCDGTAKLKL